MTPDLVLRLTLLLTLSCIAAWLLRRRSAALRHAVWTACLAASLGLPVLLLWPPEIQVPVPARAFSAGPRVESFGVDSSGPAAAAPSRNAEVTATAPPSQVPWTDIVFGVWLAGAAAIGGRWIVGSRRVSRLARQAKDLEPGVLRSERGGFSPLVFGVVRPQVLLPSEASAWSPEVLQCVLRHERAHVERRDPLLMAVGQLALVAYWFHPMVWLAVRRQRIEAEFAADDRALGTGLAPTTYAESLVAVARQLRPIPNTASMSGAAQLAERVRGALDPSRSRARTTRRQLGTLGGISILVPLALSASVRGAPIETDAVRIVSIARRPEGSGYGGDVRPQRWTIDNSPLPQGAPGEIGTEKSAGIPYSLTFEIGVPGDVTLLVKAVARPDVVAGRSFEPTPVHLGGGQSYTHSQRLDLPSNLSTVDVEAWIASGPWADVAASPVDPNRAMKRKKGGAITLEYLPYFQLRFLGKDGQIKTIPLARRNNAGAPRLPKIDPNLVTYRYVAVLRDGSQVPITGGTVFGESIVSPGGLRDTALGYALPWKAEFGLMVPTKNWDLRELREIRLQTRPWRKHRFDDIPLRPDTGKPRTGLPPAQRLILPPQRRG